MEYYFQSLPIATEINHFFDLALPIGGVLSIPFIGLLLDNFTTLTVLTVLLTISLTIGIFGMTTVLALQYIGIIILVVYRPFYYTCISDFCAKVFGFKTFGTVYGAITCFSGVCNLFQTGLDQLTHSAFKMNPNPVNGLLVGLTGLIGGAMVAFVKSQELKNRKNLMIRQAMGDDDDDDDDLEHDVDGIEAFRGDGVAPA
ncbi:unnamed protein product [Ambrosiozyma monospora]|uniref:Unnamed protein product n=1 Tax=Ambrosiozyma monospora TaxID=43982 RepID=A0ACB5TPW2_AMBMO|nr:unnamed protein product [Ambrosiozyma monospora]